MMLSVKQLASQRVIVEFSIGYTNDRIRGYEMRYVNCAELTACILHVHQTGDEFSKPPDFRRLLSSLILMDRRMHTGRYADY